MWIEWSGVVIAAVVVGIVVVGLLAWGVASSWTLQPFRMPDGSTLWAYSSREANLLWHEMFEMPSRLSHGLELDKEGAVVMDVGSNIGVFTRWLLAKVRPARVHCYEPVEPTLRALRKNVASDVEGGVVTVHGVGLGDTAATFEGNFCPRWTCGASMVPELAKAEVARSDKVSLATFLDGVMEDAQNCRSLPLWITQPMRALLLGAWPLQWLGCMLTSALLLVEVVFIVLTSRKEKIPVIRASEAIDHVLVEDEVTKSRGCIDLLKIDVEGAEEGLLRDIREDQWPRIRQVWSEVHDVGGRLERVVSLLREKGYEVVAEQEDFRTLRLWGVWVIFAHRPATARS